MATVAVSPNEPEIAFADQCVVMHNIGWEGYLRVSKVRGETRRPKLVYLDGDLYLMSPAYPHEQMADRLSDLVKLAAYELQLGFKSARSTTFRRRKNQAGAEADASFYFKNLERIRGRRDLNLRRDPPPDLAIEAVHTHAADAAVEAWQRFRVPEVWVADTAGVHILILGDDGTYAESVTSVTIPTLTAIEIFGWMTYELGGNDYEWMDALKTWVRDVLAPRARGGGA